MTEPSPHTNWRKQAAADDTARAVRLWGYGLDCVTIGSRLGRDAGWVGEVLVKAGVRAKGERRDRFYAMPVTYGVAWNGHVQARRAP